MRSIILSVLFVVFALVANGQAYLGQTTSNVYLRKGPGQTYTQITTLSVGTQLFVESKIAENDYFKVIDIMSNKTGYVHKDYVRLIEALPENKDGIFERIGATGNESSELTIENNTSLTLTLRLNQKTYSFSPRQTRKLSVSAGTYSYTASAPGVIPDYGSEYISSGSAYSWTFYIVTTRY